MITLKNWSFIVRDNGYTAPELLSLKLKGNVYNHPDKRFADGDSIVTSRIKEINDSGLIECYSRDYQLEGPANPEWVEWLEEEGTYSKYEDLIDNMSK